MRFSISYRHVRGSIPAGMAKGFNVLVALMRHRLSALTHVPRSDPNRRRFHGRDRLLRRQAKHTIWRKPTSIPVNSRGMSPTM